jgi:fibronectin-binding autotransporter adhesin
MLLSLRLSGSRSGKSDRFDWPERRKNLCSRSKLSRKIVERGFLIFLTLTGGVSYGANTGDILSNTAIDLSVGANYILSILPLSASTTDLQLSGTYSGGTTLTIGGAALNFGTLNDLNTTQNLVISNSSTTAGSLTLNTASNSTTGANISDLLYVAAGGNLKVQSGAGTLTLNIATSGNIDNAGVLNIAGPLNIAAGQTATFTGAGTTTVSGVIGAFLGSVAVNNASGSVTLSGNNSYLGNTTITSGTLNAANIVVTGGVSSIGNSTGNVVLGGTTTAGLLNYTGSSATYTRGFSVNAGGGEVDVATAGQTLTIGTGNVLMTSGTFTVGGAGNVLVTSLVGGGGTGGLTKTGTGTLTLTGADNYAGVTNINGGVLQISSAGNLGSAAATNTIGFNGGTLESTGSSYSLGTTRSIALNGAGAIQVDTGTLTLNGALSGAGTLTKTGAGILSLTVADAGYTGGLVQSAGTLSLANTAALSASNLVTINGGIFDLNGLAQTVSGLNGTGGTITNSSGTSSILTLGGSGTTSYSGTISTSSALSIPTVLGLTVALTGSGSQTLSGADTYTGLTTVNSGTLVLGSSTALGNGGLVRSIGTGGTIINSGGTLDLNGQTNINEVLSLNGTGAAGLGVLINSSASAATIGSGVSSINVSGTLTGLSANTTVSIGAPTSGTTATATASLGVTSGSFNINSGSTVYTVAPTVTIGGGTGATAVANLVGGVVTSITITNPGSGFTSVPTITFSGGSVLIQATNPSGTGVNGQFTLDGIAVTGNGSGYTTTPTVTLSSGSVTTTANLTSVSLAGNSSVGGTGDLTINAGISGSATGLTKVGVDTVTLGSVETYTGATVISSGTLALGVANAIASSTSLGISGGGTLSLGSTNTSVNGDVTLTNGNITGTGTLTASSVGTSYSLLNGSVSAILAGTGDTLAKVTDGTISGGKVILSATEGYTGATTINAGTLEVDGSLSAASAVTIGGASGSATPTLTGSGTINGAVTVSSANGGSAGTVNPGGVGSVGTLTVGSITFQNGSDLSLDLSGVNTDLLNITHAATIVAGAGISIAGNALSLGDYVLATAASGLNSASFTVVGSLPSGYKLVSSSTELDLQHLSNQSLTSTTSTNISIILGSSTPIGAILSNIVPVGSSFLNVNLADAGGNGGVVSGFTSSAGTTIAGGATSTIAGTLTATTAGLGETWGFKNVDLGALTSNVSVNGTLNVYNHSTPTLTIASGNNQSTIIGGTLSAASLTLSDTIGTFPAPLDVNTLNNLTGVTGSGVIATGGTGTYTSGALNTTTAGIGQTLGVSLKAGDQQTIIGAGPLSTLSQTITYNVYNHSTPTLTIGTGNNQAGIVGSSLSAATLVLADTAGVVPAPLDVSTLTNLSGATGSGVVGSGSIGSYTSAALNTSTAGFGKTLTVSLNAGDQQTVNGANPLTTLAQTITYNVYNHSAPTLTIAGGNNQSVFVNGSLGDATLTLADTAGTVPAPLDVTTLTNVTGATGSGVIGSGGTGTYTVAGFNTTVAGIGKTLGVSLKSGDQQTITGANALSTLSQTLTYNVYNHATPTLTITAGNNQSGIVGSTLANATFSLSDLGTAPAPLDVNTLTNLTGLTGSGVIGSGNSGSYTSSALNTSAAGVGQTLAVSLKAGDQQSISGANALSTLNQTVTYNVYNHSTPTLSIGGGNNQSTFVNGTITGASLSLADLGIFAAPLDVNSLMNLTGATGSGVIGSGAIGTYTATGFNTSAAGLGETLTVSLTAGDQQTISGANPLTALNQTITYNVYNHATPTLSIGLGNNQSGFVNGTISGATVTLADTGTVPAPLDVNTLTNLIGATGSGVIGSNSSGTYSVTGFNTSTAGVGKTLAVSLKAGDQQTISGANPLSTLSQNITYNIYNHATPTLTVGSGNNQSAFVNGVVSGATVTLSDTGTVPAPLDVAALNNLIGATGSGVVGSNSSGTYSVTGFNTSTAGTGQTLNVSLQAGDQQTISGANPLSTLQQTVTYNVYNHSTPTLSVGSGNDQSTFVNGTIAGATISLADLGSFAAPLDVNSLTNLTGAIGSGVIGSGATGTYAATGFNTSTAGLGETLTVGLTAGDQQTISGANPLAALNQTITYNVYNHATPTLSIGVGNNQSAFVNGAISSATVTLADSGTVPAPLDVNTLSNLLGATGSGVIGSNTTGTYTATGFNTSTAGIGKTLAVSLKAGDQQTISGANPLSALNQSITYNIYNHATPTLTVGSGNNQSAFVNGVVTGATVTLSDSGTVPAPLDVASLTNLIGATGSGVIGSGSSGTYSVTGFNTSTAGTGQTLNVSLQAGDQQTINGANPLGTLNQTVTYNVFNHATPTLSIGGGNNQSTFVNGTITGATISLVDPGSFSAPLDVNSLMNLTGATGSGVIGSGATGTYTVTGFNTSSAGLGETLTVGLNAGDQQTISGANPLVALNQTITYNVYNHAMPTLSIGVGNNQSAFVNGTIFGATVTLADPGTASAPLDVNTLSNLLGATGSGVIAPNSTGTYTATGFNTTAAGIGKTLAVSLKAGDQQTISGANPLSTLSQNITYNIYNHATPTLTVGSGNNQSAFVNGAVTGATVTLSDSGTAPAPLDFGALNNLIGATGSGVIGSNSSGTYSVTGFNTSTVGIGQTLNVSLQAGDQQTISGANPLSTLQQTVTYNVYNHATPTLTIASGNSQSIFVNGLLSGVTLTLADGGTTPAPLDVNSLTNLSGLTGSGVIGSGSSGLYIAIGFNTSAAGLGETLNVSLQAGDQQSISGANALSTLGQTVTYNVYNHSTPTLAIATGNNQSGIVGSTLANATFSLSDPGSLSVSLDVNALSNLTGMTGSAVINAGGSGTYTSTALDTSTAGVGQTLVVGLQAGDEQSLNGANPLSALTQTVTYNIYNHSTPTLTISAGNNQSGIVGSILANATVTLADTGTVPAPLDVNGLTNLNGTSGSGVIGSGSSGTFTSAALNTSTVGIGQTLAVSLNAGDQQTIAGANPLTTFAQTVTYNVFNHSTPTLAIGTGNNQSVFLNGSVTAPTVILSDTAGTLPAPLDVGTLNNLTGATGSGVIASGTSGTYTATGFNTSTVGLNKTLTVGLKAGDQQSVVGANPLTTLNQTLTYNVVNHATSTLTSGTLNLGDVHLGYTAPVVSTNSLTTTNGIAADLRVNLQGSAAASGNISLNSLSGIASGGSSTISATLAAGQGLGAINTPFTYNFADQSAIAGALGTVGTAAITITGQVYSGIGTWAGNGTGIGSWGTVAAGFGLDWGANQGSPGLDANFTSTDTATFGNVAGQATQLVNLNGANPSLNSITFNSSTTNYTIATGTGGTVTLNGGAGSATITDAATGGTQTISAPVILATNTTVNVSPGQKIALLGGVSGPGGVNTTGLGTTVLAGINTYSGPTTINAGVLEVDGSLAANSTVTIGGASATDTPTLTGIGLINGAVTVASAGGGVAGTINPGGVGTTGILTVGSITFQTGSVLALDVNGAASDVLNVTHAANIAAGAEIQISGGTFTLGNYVLATAASGLNSNAFTLVGSLPSGYQLVATATTLDLQHLGQAIFTSTSPGTLNMIAGSSTLIGATLTNSAPLGSSLLNVNLADNGGTGGVVSGLTSSTGLTVGTGLTSTISGTLTAGGVGLGQTWGIKNTDPTASIPTTSTGGTVNVYNHSSATLTVASGNNQSGIVGSTLANPLLTLTDAGVLPVPLDVNTLSNLTGSTGSGVVGTNGSGTYTSVALNTSTAGIGKTLTESLNAGDQQTVVGANALATLSQTITYNVYNHSTPSLSIVAGNNQSAIVGSPLANATLSLNDVTGVVPAPLDVATLTNLTGTTGSGVIGSGTSGTYSSTSLNTSTAGVGQTLAVSLQAGDQQTIVGANPLSTLSQTITYNVYNHSTPILAVTVGNNQSGIVGSTLSNATLTLFDISGAVPAPLDVNALTNLTGATGSGAVASGTTTTYVSAALNTTTAGVGQTLAVGLQAGDSQTISGANPLAALAQNVTYNVYNHSTPTLSIAAGNNQSVFLNSTVSGATVTLANTGTAPAPLDVNTLSNLNGTTGSSVVSSGGSGVYTATGFNTSTVGTGQTLQVGLKAGDSQTVMGASPLGTLGQTITYNVYNHAASNLTSGTLNLGNIHVGYTGPITSTNSLTATNGTVNDLRVNLQGSAAPAGNVSLNSLSGIASGSSGTISATLGVGQGVGTINAPITYTFADQSAIAGALSNVGTAAITVSGQVYSGNGVWAGNGTASGSWGTLATGFGTSWGANQGSPGLDVNFVSTDTATFGNVGGQASQTVTLNGANPSLNSVTFNASSTSYTISQGSGGAITLNGGSGSATVTDSATGGTQTINAPVGLATDTNANVAANRKLNFSGNITGPGGLTTTGLGTTVLSGVDTYADPTTINSGTLAINGSTLSTGAVMVGNGGTLAGTGSTGLVMVAGGGNINLQDGVIGTLTVGSLSLANAGTPSTLSFDIGSGTTGNVDHIVDNGTLVLNPTGGTTINIGAVSGTPVLTSGTYNLITSTGVTGTLADLSLSRITLDGKALSLDLVGNSLDLIVSNLDNTTTYGLSATTSDSRIMVNTGSTTVTSTIVNTGSADTVSYEGLGVTTTAGTLSGGTLPQDGGPLAINGGAASGTITLSGVNTTGTVTITPTVSSATNTNLGGNSF